MANSKRKCGGCGSYFRPETKFPGPVAWCSFECAMRISGKRKEAAQKRFQQEERKEHRQAKERVKTRSEWLKEAQAAVNAYVRERDKGNPCISCGKPDDGSHQRHASHFRSTKACSVLRFHLHNIHASCAQCNNQLSGNLLEYRRRLSAIKGPEYVEWLENQNEPRRYGISYLARLKLVFKRKLARLKALHNQHLGI
jgi:hypothetical protein